MNSESGCVRDLKILSHIGRSQTPGFVHTESGRKTDMLAFFIGFVLGINTAVIGYIVGYVLKHDPENRRGKHEL